MEQKLVLTLLWLACWLVFFGGQRSTRVPVHASKAFRLSTYGVGVALGLWSVAAWTQALTSAAAPFWVAWSGIVVTMAGQSMLLSARRSLPLSNYDTLFSIAASYVQRGIYAYVRHPMYMGLMLALVGTSLALGGLPSLAVPLACVALLLGVRAAIEQ